MCERALGAVLRVLEAKAIPALPIKGVLLARDLYDDPSERPLSDVDLLLRPRDFVAALRAAREAGFPLVWDSKTLGNVNFRVDRIAADVASALGPPGTAAIGVAELLGRATWATTPSGVAYRRIEWHDHALVMLVDTFKDKLVSKRAAREDLLRFATRGPFEPAVMAERIREAELTDAACIVLDWLLASSTSPAWWDVRERTRPRARRPGYRRAFLDAVARGPAAYNGFRTRVLARAAADAPLRWAWALSLGLAGTVAWSAIHRTLPELTRTR
jgi:hypothetical protein